MYNLSTFINGDIQEMIDALKLAENAEKLIQLGANVLVAGSSVFKSKNPTQTISLLKNLS